MYENSYDHVGYTTTRYAIRLKSKIPSFITNLYVISLKNLKDEFYEFWDYRES